MGQVRACRAGERETMLAIINAAAEAYRGVIPDDCFHDPYMSAAELDREIAAGVAFWGYEDDERLVGLMGIQTVDDVELIRHAYVEPAQQGRGVGTQLLKHLVDMATRPVLVGTWSAAEWAIRFYERHSFELADAEPLLRRYWDISDRQIETSVVLRHAP
jgi:GNAT superfamily N-acetyltransferase